MASLVTWVSSMNQTSFFSSLWCSEINWPLLFFPKEDFRGFWICNSVKFCFLIMPNSAFFGFFRVQLYVYRTIFIITILSCEFLLVWRSRRKWRPVLLLPYKCNRILIVQKLYCKELLNYQDSISIWIEVFLWLWNSFICHSTLPVNDFIFSFVVSTIQRAINIPQAALHLTSCVSCELITTFLNTTHYCFGQL